jgi:FAD/FMN-containing dehydrogenase
MIDLSPMKGIWINPINRRARVEPGVTWVELNHDLQAFGLAGTGGYYSTTGVAGLTLGGGLGFIMRKYGLACDNLLSADVVTADGRFLTASSEQHQELFWGLRGGGGNFGIVTSFELQVHPAGIVLAGLLLHPLARGKELLRFYREYTATAPEELTTGFLLFTVPPAPFLPQEAHGMPVAAVILVYTGSIEAGEEVIRPLRAFGPPLADLVQPLPYSVVQTLADPLWLRGFHNYWKSSFVRELSDEAIETLVSHFATVPSPLTPVALEHCGGAIDRVGEQETAFPHRGWPYNLIITSMWSDPADAEKNIRWTREYWEAMQPFAADAVYVNFLGAEGEERVRAAYGANYERLVALKNTYDPMIFFHLNQNIRPTVHRP